MTIRIAGFLSVFVAAMSSIANGEVLIDHSLAELWVNAQAYAWDIYCQEQVNVETLGTTELACSKGELPEATADSFASVSMSASLDNTHMSMRFGSVSNVTGYDPTPKSEAPFAGGRGWANLGFSVTDEPMVVTMTIVDIGTDPGPSSVSEMRAYLILPGPLGSIISHAGQTTQTGAFTGTLQPGQGGYVYVEFEDAIAYTANRDAFARVEFTLDFEPARCTEPNTVSNVAGEFIGWNNPAGGSYSVASNWDPPRVPTHDCSEGDTAVFELDDGPIDIDASNATAGSWRVLNSLYLFRGPAQLYSASTTDVSLEISHDGLLSLVEGTLGTVHSRIGNAGGSTAGRVNVYESTAVWENAGQLDISNGLLSVSYGGKVFTDDLSIATAPDHTATVRVSGITGFPRSTIESAEDITVGQGGNATLEIRDGAHVLAEKCAIGSHSDGAVVIAGSSNPDDPFDTASYATLQADGLLQVGGDGVGSLRIEQGGAAMGSPVMVGRSDLSASGRLVVDGQGGIAVLNARTGLDVHNGSQVEVEAVNGGRIAAEAIGIGGGLSTGSADVTVRGSASQPDEQLQSSISTKNFPETVGGVGVVSIGKESAGQLNVLSGGRANFRGGLVVGENAQGIVLVSAPDIPPGDLRSHLSVTGETRVGVNSFGLITIGPRSDMEVTGELRIGLGTGNPSGSVNLENGSNMTVDGTLAVGVFGKGMLTVHRPEGPGSRQSRVACVTLQVGGDSSQATGLVTMNFTSLLEISGNAQVGVGNGFGAILLASEGTHLEIGGTMTIGNPNGGPGGGNVAMVDAIISGTGNIVVNKNGSLTGTGAVSVPHLSANGQISPGLSPGTLTINGDYEQLPGGVLEIEYAGLNPGEFDVLHVTGQATLGGRLEVHFRNGFSPDDPQTFIHSQSFIEADEGITGDYEERIYAFPDIFADFDDDDDKDLRDVAAFQNCFGLSGGGLEPACSRADWEGNGVLNEVEVRELSAWLNGPQ